MNFYKNFCVLGAAVSISLCLAIQSEQAITREKIDIHKQEIARLVAKRVWARRGMYTIQAVSTGVTLAEFFFFMKDLFNAAQGNAPIDSRQTEPTFTGVTERAKNIGIMLGGYLCLTAAKNATMYFLQQYYYSVMQDENSIWFTVNHAFYKSTIAEARQHGEAWLIDANNHSYQALQSAGVSLISCGEKIVAFMEYKADKFLTANNRTQAHNIAQYIYNSLQTFAQNYVVLCTSYHMRDALIELQKLEALLDREIIYFARLEGVSQSQVLANTAITA
jgi:hypothetical protein